MAAVAPIRRQVQLCIGKAGVPVGSLVYVRQGRRENSVLAYDEAWLADPTRFNVSADLQLVPGYQPHKAASPHDSVFHGAVADTAPDAWGRRVIARDHTKRRKADPQLPALTEFDDFSRVGALRLRDPDGTWHRMVPKGRRSTPPLMELEHIFQASRAVERGQETVEDLRYLQGKGTSLGGMRPKCSVVDEDGWLAIGKFPSVSDIRSVTRGEVLAMKLAAQAGIDAAPARIVLLGDKGSEVPVAVIRRFDRDEADGRIPYQSAASVLQASRDEDRSYTEIADAIRSHGHRPTQDLRQLWRRLAFNLLITNVDDHLQNHGFLHVAHGQWRLAPAFASTRSRTRSGSPRPGCPSRTGRSPISRCCWRAPPISRWTRNRLRLSWPRYMPRCRIGAGSHSARKWACVRRNWTISHPHSSTSR